MSDRLFFPLATLLAVGMVALAVVWPQGLGRRSPPPFGHALASRSVGRPAPSLDGGPRAPRADTSIDP